MAMPTKYLYIYLNIVDNAVCDRYYCTALFFWSNDSAETVHVTDVATVDVEDWPGPLKTIFKNLTNFFCKGKLLFKQDKETNCFIFSFDDSYKT